MNIDNEEVKSACSFDKSISNKSVIDENNSKDIDVENIKERIIEENYNESSKYSNENSDKSSARSVNNNENINIDNNMCIDLTNKSNLTTIKEELGNPEVSIGTNSNNNINSRNNNNNNIDRADISNNININFKKDDSNNTYSSTYRFNKFYNYTTKIIPDNEKLLRKSSNNLTYVITPENKNLDNNNNKPILVNPEINHDYDYCIENSYNNNLTNNYSNEECLFNINNNISNAFVNIPSQNNINDPPIFNHQSNSNILNTSYISNTSCNNLNNFNARFNSCNQNYQNNQNTLNFQNFQNLQNPNSSFSNNNFNLFSQSQNKLSSPISNYRHFDLNLNKSNNNSLYLNTNTYNNVNFDENDKDDLFSAFNSNNDLENITVLSKLQSKMNSRNTSKRKNKISEYERKIDFGYGSIYNNIDNNENDININNNINTTNISKGFNYEKLVIDRRPISLNSLINNDTKDEDNSKMIVDNEANNDIKEDNSNREDSKNSNNTENSVSNNYNTNQTHTNTNKEISESKNELSIYNVGEFVFEGNKIDITNKTPNKYTKLSMDCYTFGGNSQNNSNMIPINHAENNNIVKIRDFSIDNNNNFTNNNTYPTNNTLTSNSLNNYNSNIASYNPNNNVNNNINNIMPKRNLSKSFKNTLSIDETITDRSYYNNSSDSLCFESFSFSLNDDSNTNIRNAFRKYRKHIEEDISNLNRKGYSNISVTEIHEIQDFITLFCRHYPNYFYDSFDEIIDSSGLENYLRRRKAKERKNKEELANNIISSSNSAIPTMNNIEKKDIICNASLSYKNNKVDKKEDDSIIDN